MRTAKITALISLAYFIGAILYVFFLQNQGDPRVSDGTLLFSEMFDGEQWVFAFTVTVFIACWLFAFLHALFLKKRLWAFSMVVIAPISYVYILSAPRSQQIEKSFWSTVFPWANTD